MLVLQEQKPVNMSNYTQSTRFAHGAGSTQSTRYSQSTRFAHGLGPAHGAGSSPQMIEKMTAKWLSLATTSILGQAPSYLRFSSRLFITGDKRPGPFSGIYDGICYRLSDDGHICSDRRQQEYENAKFLLHSKKQLQHGGCGWSSPLKGVFLFPERRLPGIQNPLSFQSFIGAFNCFGLILRAKSAIMSC